MKMKANNNNDITDYYLALFSSINCATAPDNRNKKIRSIKVNNKNTSLNSSKCLIHAANASLIDLQMYFSRVCFIYYKIELLKFLQSSTHFQIEILPLKDFILPGY